MATARALGLSRAITQCTEPYTQQLPGAVLRSLQAYLLDPQSVDTVYHALIDRALAEPVSAAIVSKVLIVLKQLLLRHPPSQDVLSALANFCADVPNLTGSSPAEMSMLQYITSCVQRLSQGDATAGVIKSQLSASASGAMGASPKLGGTASNTYDTPSRVASRRNTLSPQTVPPAGLGAAGASQDGAPPAPLLLPEEPGVLPGWAVQPPALLQDLLGPGSAVRASHPAPLSMGTAAQGPDTRWMDHVPELIPYLVTNGQNGARVRAPDSVGEDPGTSQTPVGVTQLARCVLDLSEDEQRVHLQQVAKRLHAEAARLRLASENGNAGAPGIGAGPGGRGGAQHAGANRPGAAHARGAAAAGAGYAGAGAGREKRKRMLYHHPPYITSDPLQMTEADIGVVVQVVCGVGAAHALLSHEHDTSANNTNNHNGLHVDSNGNPTWPTDGDANTDTAQGPDQHKSEGGQGVRNWEDEYNNGNLGQVCGAILVKLMIDMWRAAGPANSYLLVMRMLKKTLTSRKPQIRARAFDLVYNLSLHATLLEPAPHTDTHNSIDTRTPLPSRPPSMPGTAAIPQDTPPAGRPAARTPPSPTRSQPVGARGSQEGGDAQTPASQPADAPDAAAAAAAAAAPQAGVAHAKLAAWVRAVLFQLLETLAEAEEETECVWQSALSALLHTCTSGGHWVMRYVELLPLTGLSALLNACVAFRWSPDIHSHLLRLAAVLLIHADTSSTIEANGHADTMSVADSAAELTDGPSNTAHHIRAVSAPVVGPGAMAADALHDTRAAAIPTTFGGLQGLLNAYAHAPCPLACMDMLTVLLHYLTPDSSTAGELARVIASRGAAQFSLALQTALRAPSPNMALRLSAALCGIGIAPAATSDAFDGTAAGAAAATIRALGGVPAASSTLGGGHMTIAAGSAGGGAAVLPPAGAKLILNMLTVVENQALLYRQALQRSPQLAARIQLTLNHISTSTSQSITLPVSSNDPTLAPPPATLAAAWQDLKDACSSVVAPCVASAAETPTPASSSAASDGIRGSVSWPQPAPAAPADAVSASATQLGGMGAGMGEGRSLRSARSRGRSQNELRSSVVLMSPPTALCAGRHVALHWLHQALLQALKVTQSNPLLLTPLNLRTSDAGKVPSAKSLVLGLRASAQQQGQQAQQTQQADSPVRVGSWTGQLADVLLHCVREVVGGCSLLVAAMARAITDIKQSTPDPTVRHHLVMTAHYIVLLWVMQSGDVSPGSDSHKAAQELADQVLAALSRPRPLPPSYTHNNNLSSFSMTLPSPSMASAFLRPRLGGSAAARPAGAAAAVLQLPAATALVTGNADFAPEPLQATAPELLVALLRSCAQQQRSQAHTMQRGLYGRPGPGADSGGTEAPVRQSNPGGFLPLASSAFSSAASGLPRSAWEDVTQDRRLALLMALMARCLLDPDMFAKYGLSHLVKEAMLPSEDPRERYYAGVYLLRHWQLNQQDKYWRMLRQLVLQAQQLNDETLLDNPYLTVVHMLSVEGQG